MKQLNLLMFLHRELKTVLGKIVRMLISPIPKKKGLALFTAWHGEKYIDNTKYLFEYFLSHPEYKITPVWCTRNKIILKQLKEEKKPVVNGNSLKGWWLTIRSQFLFSTIQFADYPWYLLNKCIYIDLGHGHVIKDPGKVIRNIDIQRQQEDILNYITYYSFSCSQFSKEHNFSVPSMDKENNLISNFARNDLFFDSNLRKGLNEDVSRIISNRKTIVYMPTHRSEGKVKIEINKIFDLKKIQEICFKNNSVFLIKKHFFHQAETEELDNYPNIIDISNYNIDPQMLLYQADLLVSDYSACYIDYLLLDRPFILYHYDYEYFQENERSFFIPYSSIKAANIVCSKDDFSKILESVLEKGDDGLSDERIKLRSFYFSNEPEESGRKSIAAFVYKLLNKTE